METKICASIGTSTIEELEEKVKKALELGADLIELRLDYLSKIDVNSVSELVKEFAEKIILTLRPTWEGGYFSGREEDRIKLLLEIVDANPAYIDVELDVRDLGKISEKMHEDTSLIISKHDFEGNLTKNQLRELALKALKFGGIAKVITTARDFSDNLKILSLYNELPPEKLIAFAMGERGVISRILSPLMGAPIAYACLPGEAVAPGQLTVSEFREFLKLVRGR